MQTGRTSHLEESLVDGRLLVWDTDEWNRKNTPIMHSDCVTSVSLSADGSRIVSAGGDDYINIQNVGDNKDT